MNKQVAQHIPENAIGILNDVLEEHPINIKIVNSRKSKHGDFKKKPNIQPEITINNSLNKYHFLLTIIHELAHFITFKKHKRVKPHGKEWKQNFQHLMLPFLQPTIFPNELLPFLANYLKNPKASTGSDTKLTYALKQYDAKSDKSFIFEIEFGSLFMFNNKTYKKGRLRRTRFECTEISDQRIYLFNKNAEVKLLKNYEK
jgi:hypothetical protein